MSTGNSRLGIVPRPDPLERNCPRCSRPYTDLGEPPGGGDTKLMTALQNLPLCLKMAEFQEDFGMMASPEWFEENIAKQLLAVDTSSRYLGRKRIIF